MPSSAARLCLTGCIFAFTFAGGLQAQYNPNGWIRSDGWNFLLPLLHSGGCYAGGAEHMLENWVTPHEIGLEDPKDGDVWDDIDFGAAASDGYGGAGFVELQWMTLGSMWGSPPVREGLLFDELINRMNSALEAPLFPGRDVLAMATTYVENLTGAPLEIDVCTASDDSAQVWVNNVIVTNVSACRAAGPLCAEKRPAILPPGVSKIALLVWQGAGGWGAWLGLEAAGSRLMDGNTKVRFLGPGVPGTTEGQVQYRITRTVTAGAVGDLCSVTGSATLALTGSGPGPPGDVLTLVEEVRHKRVAPLSIAGVSDGGAVMDIITPQTPSPVGTFDDHRVIGDKLCPGVSNTTHDSGSGVYTSLSNTGGDVWETGDAFEFAYCRMEGDFDISIEFVERSHSTGLGRWGKFGLMAREALDACTRFTSVNDHLPDLQDPVVEEARTAFDGCIGMFEESVLEGPPVSPHPLYVRLTRRGSELQAWASDDPMVETTPGNDALWTRVGRRNDWGPDAPSALFVGFFNCEHSEGGCADQTIRFRVIQRSGTVIAVQDPRPIGKRITWTVPRSVVSAGLEYTASTDGAVVTQHSGVVAGRAIVGGADTLLLYETGNHSGPMGAFEDSHDIGRSPVAGMTTFHSGSGTYTMSGSGGTNGTFGDSHHFAYRRVTGDFVMTGRITGRSDPSAPDATGRHGLMARWTCHPRSKFSMLQTSFAGSAAAVATPRHAERAEHSVALTIVESPLPDGILPGFDPAAGDRVNRRPEWMRLERRGKAVYTYLSFDDPESPGSPLGWCLAGFDHDPNMPDTVLAGMALWSGPGASTASITFDSFSLVEDFPPPQCAPGHDPFESINDFSENEGGDPAGAIVVQGGNARPYVREGRLRLTEGGVNNQANAVWFILPGTEALAESGFTVEFDAFISQSGGACQGGLADGMTLAVVAVGPSGDPFEAYPPGLDVATLRGIEGGALGYGGGTLGERSRCHAGFAVELDTWVNGDDPGAGSPSFPCQYHFGLDVNGSFSSIQTNVSFGVPSVYLPSLGIAGLHVEVQYHDTGLVTVYAGEGNKIGWRKVLSSRIPPLEGEFVIGFTGSTGSWSSVHDVDNFALRPFCCGGAGSLDCNSNGIGDECEDECNGNGVPDECDIASEASEDCNANDIPDECDLAAGTSTDVNSDDVPDECQLDIRVVPVPVTINPATTTGVRSAEPVAVTAVTRGATFWLEVWASDVGDVKTGLTGVYVDIGHCGATTAQALFHGSTFTQFESGTIASGWIDEFGGSSLPHGGGIEPEWVRVGWVRMRADSEAGSCDIGLAHSSTGIAAFQRGVIGTRFLELGYLSLAFSTPSISYDLDASGSVGLGDLSLFAGSWLADVPPADEDHDFDCDEFVGPGDLSWFATAWLKGVNDSTIQYPPCALGAGGGAGSTEDVRFELVALREPSGSDMAPALPDGVRSVEVGGTFYLELWASDVEDINTGLTSAYVDLSFPDGSASVAGVTHGSGFEVFLSGAVGPGIVDELGGSNLEGVGIQPEWSRVAVVELRADAEAPAATFSLAPSVSGVACLGRGLIPWSAVGLDTLRISLGSSSESFLRGDTNADGEVNVSDPIATLNWLFVGAADLVCVDAADANDSSKVDISDGVYVLQWLFLGGPAPDDPGPHACGPDPTEDELTECLYPPGACSG